MVRSKRCRLFGQDDKARVEMEECKYDQGGYFVINGSEKVIIAQERQAANRVYCFHKRPPSKFTWVAEMRSVSESSNRPISSLELHMVRKGEGEDAATGGHITAKMPFLRADVPVMVMLRALDFETDRTVLSHVVFDLSDQEMVDRFLPSIKHALHIQRPEHALDHIARRGPVGDSKREARVKYAFELLQKDFLPHIGVDASARTAKRKGYFLGYVVHRLLLASLGRAPEDDRDHFANKRCDMAGPLIAGLFRQLFYKLTKTMSNLLRKELDRHSSFMPERNIAASIQGTNITRGLRYSLATGNWGLQEKGAPPKTGVSQVLNRLTYASSLSHLRRLTTPIGREGKQAKPRQLHNTQWGMICPCETPEGQAVGLVKNLALMSYVTVGSDSEEVQGLLHGLAMMPLEDVSVACFPLLPLLLLTVDSEYLSTYTRVFVNGNWVGVVPDVEAKDLVDSMRGQRRLNTITFDISITRDIDAGEIHVFTDAGRLCRPLFIVEHVENELDKEHPIQQRLRITEDMFMDLQNEVLGLSDMEVAEG
ncbi:NRPB2, partial [Symbiodinium sp. KB8]